MDINWGDYTDLDVIELAASGLNNPNSEEELSEMFDNEIAPHVIEQYGEDDGPAMNEAFNNWTDQLCKDGVIHPIQYERYCYTGKYS